MEGPARLQVLGVACGVWHTAAVARPWQDRRDPTHWAIPQRGPVTSSGASGAEPRFADTTIQAWRIIISSVCVALGARA